MKKLAIVLVILALAAPAFAVSPNVRISQVYGGGGSTSTTPPLPVFNQDFVELYNASNTAVDISNWAIEYASATGLWGSYAGNIFIFPAGTVIQPCSYILVGGNWLATYTGAALSPAPDFTGLFSASATGGKFGLFNAVNTNLACGSELPGTLVDKISYGTSTNCAETTPTAGLSTQLAAIRNMGGYVDTDNNAADFTIGTPAPRNSASPINLDCGVPVATEPQTWGSLKASYR
ncbi:MAG: lamin tail domain-containing protein [Candidatus Krumholzibacteriia bacterium]